VTTGLIGQDLGQFGPQHNPNRAPAGFSPSFFGFSLRPGGQSMRAMQAVNPPVLSAVRIEHLYVSSGHRFVGRHGKEPLDFPAEEVPQVECVAGRGIRGDRFFDHRSDYKGQVTFFSMEVFDSMCRDLGVHDRPPSVLRRNVFVRDADLLSLVGCEFTLQGVAFVGAEECKPCYWMDGAFGPGAEAYLRGRGGLRARIASDGILRSAPP
jgi:MOSC domain-containing protein YiiM